MSVLSIKVNQFIESNCATVLQAVNGTTVGPTVSLCHQCHQHIPAYTYHKDGQLWLVKSCRVHGISHHMIERDYEFLSSLAYNKEYYQKDGVLFEVSDRCNVECPHCYHMPDNKILDKSVEEIVEEIKTWYQPGLGLILTGAEAALHKNFVQLIDTLIDTFKIEEPVVMTNGIRFADKEFLKECLDAGLDKLSIGLNHPSYLDNQTIRRKQIQAIENSNEIGMGIGYISYTMSSISELEDILEESTSVNWNPKMYRIRYGSDIGRYPNQERMYVSDIYKLTKAWCDRNNKEFKIIDGDNNIYHVMVSIDGQAFRLIQWCDEKDIHMEELRTGPWCSFVPDGLTNFLHQIIRRDIWKNQKLALPDTPPERYQYAGSKDTSPLDFTKLY